MTTIFRALTLAVLAGGAPLLAQAADPAMTQDGMLVDHQGMALYTFDKDADGKSACYGGCAQNWPPLAAGEENKAMGHWTVIARDDGSRQWAYDGKPLYTFVQDKKAGEVTGDGKGGVWHVARP